MCNNRHNKGFTLIELLVVICIIAILAAILFPVFVTARETGRKCKCAGNAKQLGAAVQVYISDYGSWSDNGVWSGSKDPDWPYVEQRPGCNPTSTDPNTRYGAGGDSGRLWISKYVRGKGVMKCPSDSGKAYVDTIIGKTGQHLTGYYTFAWDYTLNSGCPGNFNEIRKLSKMPVWIEENTDSKTVVDPTKPYGNTINDLNFQDSDISSTRHNGTTNINFADGHVASFKGPLQARTAEWPDHTYMFTGDPVIH